MKIKLLQPLRLAIFSGIVLSLSLNVLKAGGTNTPQFQESTPTTGMEAAPVFIDPVPNDTTVNCLSEVPAPVELMAMDDMGNTFSVTPFDIPNPAAINPCTGGSFSRIWRAIADMDTVTVSQMITILPDNQAPMANIPELNDTVSCELSSMSADVNPLRFDIWVNSARVALATMATDDCSGIDNIIDDAPAQFEDHCGTIAVTFTIIDNCGATTDWVSTFTTIDTIPPVLEGVPNDTIISCNDIIPDPSLVTATDNCAGILEVDFEENSTQLMNGMCNQYEYFIIRTWSAEDSCGNVAELQQIITVADDMAPTFTVPPNITLTCNEDAFDLNVTGDVTDALDNCSPADSIEVTYIDNITPGICDHNFTVTRVWRAKDLCGNVTGKIQTITVADDQAPTFNVPPDITVDCSQASDMNITGMPVNLTDNCTTELSATFSDVVIAGTCVDSYAIQRTWRVEDECGNFTELDQVITVTDNQPPSFSDMPQNLTIFCAENQEIDILFNDWLTAMAGADATDNCTNDNDINWYIYNSGTTDPPALPGVSCPATSDTIRRSDIDIVIEDECGNQTIQTVTFALIDNIAPQISGCPAGMTLSTDPGDCNASFELMPPVIEEICSFGSATENLASILPVTTSALPGEEGDTPVDPILFNLPVTQPSPINIIGDATASITLTFVDGEEPNEYFNILGEDGTNLGITNLTDVQCGNSVTSITIPGALINEWAADGVITITLEPNIPADLDGKFAINAICNPSGTAGINLSFQVKNLGDIIFQYKIDEGPAVVGALPGPFPVSLSQGDHLITYYATDCAGNVDSCAYSVTVVDQEAPTLNCPGDILAEVAPDSCSKAIQLPLPAGAVDNCDAYDNYDRILPADTTSALITFSYDPNLNDFVADERNFVFDNVAANAFNPVMLTIDFQGDFNTNEAFMTIIGDDGSILAVTSVGAADCNTPGQLLIPIPAATFNTWAADGIVEIIALPNEIDVPPGVPGDGINPCDPGAVNNTGDNDGSSYIFASLSYERLSLSYFIEGETNVTLTNMGEPMINPVIEFDIGSSEVTYIMADPTGNVDSCSFLITIEDNIAPEAVCVSATTLFIEPSGLQVEILDAIDLDLGSTDNCGIEQRLLSPNTFTCADIGNLLPATLTVVDSSGNSATCETLVSIAPEGPVPTANSGLCGGDTLFLFANPPIDNGGVLYTFQWYFNDILFSVQENPVIPNIGLEDEGAYRVVIRGLTGCEAEGVVDVSVEALPLTPSLETTNTICLEEDLVLSTPDYPGGNNVIFYWYEGLPPNGVLLGTTMEPEFTLSGPHPAALRNFYLRVEATGCVSAPSSPQSVLTVPQPTAMVSFPDTTVCEGETINIGTLVSGSNITYQWTGPDAFTSSAQFPEVGPLATINEGYYYLVINRNNGCFSEPDSVRITIKDKPATPVISYSGPVCVGETLTLMTTATGASSYHWVNANGEEFITSIPTLEITNANLGDAGNWYIFIIKNDCISDNSLPVNVVVNPVPVASASVTPEAPCDGDSFQLIGGPDLNGGSYLWTGPGIAPQMVQSPVISNATEANEGIFTLTVASLAGCSDTATVFVEVPEKINILGVSYDAPSCLNGPTDIQLDVTVLPLDDGSYTYTWSGPGFSQTTSSSSATIPNATGALNRGEYNLTVTSGDGCEVVLAEAYFLDIRDIPAAPNTPVASDALNTYCVGETITLTTNAYMGNGFSQTTSSSSATIPNATGALNRGEYNLTVTSGDGCEVVLAEAYFLDIRDIPAAPNTPVASDALNTYCVGETITLTTNAYMGNAVTYYWTIPGGTTLTSSDPILNIPNAAVSNTGNYTVYVMVDGCISDDSTPRNITVHPNPSVTAAANTPVCAGEEIQLQTQFFPGATYQWQGPDGFNAGIQNPANSSDNQMDSLGLYWVIATLNGCVSDTAFVTVAVKPTPQVPEPLATVSDSICASLAGATLTLSITGTSSTENAQYIWYDNAGGENALNTPSTQPQVVLNDLSAYNTDGIYDFYVQADLDGCASEISEAVPVLISYIPAISPFAGVDKTVCDDETATLEAEEPATGSGAWSQVGGPVGDIVIANPNQAVTAVNGLSVDGSPYTFAWTLSNGACLDYATDEVILTISQGEAAFAGDNVTACLGEIINLGATPPVGINSTGIWTQPAAQEQFGVTIEDPGDPNTIINGLDPDNLYNFTWTITSDCGIVSDEVIVYISDPSPNAGEDVIFCNGETSGLLQAEEPTRGSQGEWSSLTPGVIITDSYQDTTTVSNLVPGENIFVWTIDDGICGDQSRDTVIIFFKEPPVAEDDIITVPFGEPVTFDPLFNDIVPPNSIPAVLMNPALGKVDEADGLFIYTPPANYVGNDDFEYEVISDGCPATSAIVTLIIGEGAQCQAPSIITPNNDGVNDNFVVPCLLDPKDFPNNKVIIFNRWGDEVFRSQSPYENNWNGQYNGEDLPAATYFYIVDFGNGEEPLKGFVVIQR